MCNLFSAAFDHIDLNGHGLEITVLKSTRLNTKLATSDQIEVYCIASLGFLFIF